MSPITETTHRGKRDARSARRLEQVDHLRRCGARVILEALIDVERGRPINVVLADFARLPAKLYEAALYFYAAMADDEEAQ